MGIFTGAEGEVRNSTSREPRGSNRQGPKRSETRSDAKESSTCHEKLDFGERIFENQVGGTMGGEMLRISGVGVCDDAEEGFHPRWEIIVKLKREVMLYSVQHS